MTSTAPWSIVKSDPNDQPPEHDPERPWCVLHPPTHQHVQRKVSRFPDHGEALTFVLHQPEVRRRTSHAAAGVVRRAAEALR